MGEKITESDVAEAYNNAQFKIASILEYIINKNSKPLSEGGMDMEKIIDEIQDLKEYLWERVQENNL